MKNYRQILVLVETSREFGRGVLRGIMRYSRDCSVPWRITFEDRGLLDGLPSDFDSWRGDGILSRCHNGAMYERLLEKKVPVVDMLHNGIEPFPEIRVDETAVSRLAADHFVSRRYRNIAYYSWGASWWSNCRRDAFIQELASRGIRCLVSPDSYCDDPMTPYPRWKDCYYPSLRRWLKQLPKPVGIFVGSDIYASRILAVCGELEIRVPDEVAVLGTSNDSLFCSLQFPPLSSLDLNAQQMGYLGAQRLDFKIQQWQENKLDLNITKKNPRPLETILVTPGNIITRQSSDFVAVENDDCAEAIQYIKENFTDSDLTALRVAEHLDLSRSTLERRFRQYLGRSVDREIFRQRMGYAKSLLLETDLPVNVIARRIGFHCFEYFFRTFKKITGMTPVQFRSAHARKY